MGLFSKKGPCAICGGKVSGLFPWKIEENYICNTCHGVVDVPDDVEKHFSFDDFLAYREFRTQNQQLKNIFSVTATIDMGLFDTKIMLDCQNRLLCFDKHLDKTIFTGEQLVSFSVKEDNAPLFEGSANGLVRYKSVVPNKVAAMAPMIERYRMQQQMSQTLDRLADKNGTNRSSSSNMIDVPEPFRQFNIEFRFKHPYWSEIRCDMSGPTFNMSDPNAYEYMQSYSNDIAELETLVKALMTIAFPGAQAAQSAGASPAQAKQAPDAAEELKKYKALMEDGVITQDDFEAKKKQLLGI